MKVFARFELSRGQLQAGQQALLLEGHWPDDEDAAVRWSLDREIDGRYGWIDQRAAELAEQFAGAEHWNPTASARGFVWLNVVKLRYQLVKLLRVVAFFSARQREPDSDACQLFYECGRDEAFRHVLAALAARGGWEWVTHAIEARGPHVELPSAVHQGRAWRLAAKKLASVFQPAVAANRPRIVLCGNPRLLTPVCRELVRRGVQPWWLTERFAPRSWLRLRACGGGLLACDGADGPGSPLSEIDFAPDRSTAILSGAGADSDAELLAPAVWSWLDPLARKLLPLQASQAIQIDRHLDQLRPQHVVLDQDGSPFCRAVVAAARRRDVPTTVVQHGAPFVRFGFAPLVADRFCAWGETSADQLQSWDVPRERIRITGTAVQLPSRVAVAGSTRPRLVLLATLAPADGRPDAVNYHQTRGSYANMIRGALASVADCPCAELVIKLHPRDPCSQVIRSIAAEFDWLAIKIVAHGNLASVLRGADCVLSCASSAGVEAAVGGWPVIQLMPQGSSDLLESGPWGLVGTARDQTELGRLIAKVLAGRWQPAVATARAIIAATGRTAAGRIADAVLDPLQARPHRAPAARVGSSTAAMPV